MRPGRRRLLQALGTTTSVAVTGCVGALDGLLADEEDGAGYTPWLVAPGTLVPAARYRFASVRPPQVTDSDRLTPLYPPLSPTGIAPTAVDRVVVGNGGFGVDGAFAQSTVVSTLRRNGYDYVDGVGNAWILATDDGDTPVYAVDDDHLAVAYPTQTRAARTVAATLVRARSADPHWTTADDDIDTITTALGDPPILTATLHEPDTTTAPHRGAFTDSVGWAIAESAGTPTATVAILFTDPATIPRPAVEAWADTVFDSPHVTATGRVVTVSTTRPPTPWTRFPVPDGAWPMPGANPGNTAAVPATRPPTGAVFIDWLTTVKVSGTVTPPVAVDDTIVLGAGDLFALTAADGSERWRVDTTILGTPAIHDRTVIAPTKAGVVAVDLDDGTDRWHRPLPAEPETGVTLANDRAIVGIATTPGVQIIDLTDGTTTGVGPQTATRPAVDDDTIYAVGPPSVLTAITRDGATRWEHRFRTSIKTPPVLDPSHVYVVTAGTIHALDRRDGTTDWTADLDTRLTAAPAVVEDHVIVGESRPGTSDPGAISVFATGDGHRQWTRALPRAVVGQPAVAGDRIHFAGAAGSISAHSLTDGEQHYATTLGGSIRPPTVLDDQLLFSTLDGRVTSLAPDWIPGPRKDYE